MKRYILDHIAILTLLLTLGVPIYSYAQGQVNVKGGPIPEAEWMVDVAGVGLGEDHSNVDTWITKWYGPDGNYENNGGFGKSAPKDLIDEGTDGKLDQLKLSTVTGLNKTKSVDINWPLNGGKRGWTVFEINPESANNTWKEGGEPNNFDTYAICVIDAPKTMKSVMSPAHDDHAQIWINGEKWYNHSQWTGGTKKVNYNVEVELKKGANVLLFRCGEGGGSAYLNLHFDDATHDAVDIYPDQADDKISFFKEITGALAIEPTDKLTTIWADIKR
ncbi:hypothetical protein F4212_07200 [Candidatus Poribacteria bacterium]|nr:hypothetical protein [Candidatus Poribacteria bacterium]